VRRRSPPGRLRGLTLWVAAFLLLSALSLYLTAGRGVSPGDESWFLLVAKRVAHGDHLYRDVSYSPLPLAVWLASVPVSLFGAHIAIVEVFAALIWAGTALLLAGHARRVSGSGAVGVLAVAALVVVAPPQRNSLYTPLAMLFLVVSLVLAMKVVDGPSLPLAFLGGAAAGLSFAAKQTVGVAALAALLVAVALAGRPVRLRAAAAAIAGFGAVALLILLQLALAGDLGDAVREGFTGKGEYLAHGSLSYVRALRDAGGLLPSQPTGAFDNLPPLLAPLAAVVLVAAARRRALSTSVLVPAAYAVAAVASAYPRFSATHLAWANAALVACAASAIGPDLGTRRRLYVALAAPLAVGCGIAFSLVPLSWANGELTFSSLSAFAGFPISRTSEDAAVRLTRTVRPAEEVFFVTEDAGFFTLVTQARDPTPYDVPATSNIGASEIASLLRGVRAGRITRACFGGAHPYPAEPSLRPRALERALARVMRPIADLGVCVLHVRTAGA
jgi:hypothetical protein